MARFLESGQVSAAEWERVRENVVVVHEQMNTCDAIEAFEEAFYEIELPEVVAGAIDQRSAELEDADLSPWQVVEELNSLLPGHLQLSPLGKVDSPVPARLWAARAP